MKKLLSIILAAALLCTTLIVPASAETASVNGETIWAWTDFTKVDPQQVDVYNRSEISAGNFNHIGLSRIIRKTGSDESVAELKEDAFVYTQKAGTKDNFANAAYIEMANAITREAIVQAGYNKVAVEFDMTVTSTTDLGAAAISLLKDNTAINSTYFDFRYMGGKTQLNCVIHNNGFKGEFGKSIVNNTRNIRIVTDLLDADGDSANENSYCSYDVYIDDVKVLTATTRPRSGLPQIQRFAISDMKKSDSDANQNCIAADTERSFKIDNFKIYSSERIDELSVHEWAWADFDTVADAGGKNSTSSSLNINAADMVASQSGLKLVQINVDTANKAAYGEIKDGKLMLTQDVGTTGHWSIPQYIVLSTPINKAALTAAGYQKIAVEFDFEIKDNSENSGTALLALRNTTGGVDNGNGLYYDLRYNMSTSKGKFAAYNKDKAFDVINEELINAGVKKIRIVSDLVAGENNVAVYDVYVDDVLAVSSTTRTSGSEPAIERLILAAMGTTLAEGQKRTFTMDNFRIYSSNELETEELVYAKADFNVSDTGKLGGTVASAGIRATGFGAFTAPTNANASAEIKNEALVYTIDGTLTNSNTDAQLIMPFVNPISKSADFDKVVVEAEITVTENVPEEEPEQAEDVIKNPQNWMFAVRDTNGSNSAIAADMRWGGEKLVHYGKNSSILSNFELPLNTPTKISYVFDLDNVFYGFFNNGAAGTGTVDLYINDVLAGSYLAARDSSNGKLASIFFSPWQSFEGTRTFTIDNVLVYSSEAADELYAKADDTIKMTTALIEVDANGNKIYKDQNATTDCQIRADFTSNFTAAKNTTLISVFKKNGAMVTAEVLENQTIASGASLMYIDIPDDLEAGVYLYELYAWDSDFGKIAPLHNGLNKAQRTIEIIEKTK